MFNIKRIPVNSWVLHRDGSIRKILKDNGNPCGNALTAIGKNASGDLENIMICANGRFYSNENYTCGLDVVQIIDGPDHIPNPCNWPTYTPAAEELATHQETPLECFRRNTHEDILTAMQWVIERMKDREKAFLDR